MLGILVGLIGGTLSGLTGLGGGFIMVPLLIYLFGMTQHQAQGTSLTVLLPPLGALAFWQYYKNGHVDVHVAILVAIGFVAGGYLGGWTAQLIPGPLLRKGFAVMMAFIALDMFFRK
ncbi:MAG TPA: sulfite exporter TauE/SafE family protein [Candidatus Dormibacteraeota bacterium]|nr:sulfite exporter TauE/SafE family protein [Candidatus Dormibacteraeota bacterium]